MFDFKEKFKDRPSIELLEMLAHPEKYQQDALAAAAYIIEQRKLDVEAWQETLAALEHSRQMKAEKEVVVNDEKDIWDIANKAQLPMAATKLQIKIIALAVVLFCLIKISSSINFYWEHFSNIDLFLSPTTIFVLAPMAYLAVALVFFLKIEKVGWTMLALYALVFLVSNIVAILFGFFMSSRMPGMDLFNARWYLNGAIAMLFFGSLFYHLWKPGIRSVFVVARSYFRNVFVIGVFLSVCYIAFSILRNYL